jgi:hypothetical protein
MIGTLIGLIFLLIILGVLFWAAQSLVALIPLSEPFATIIRILFILITVLVVIWVLIIVLGIAGIHVNIPSLK